MKLQYLIAILFLIASVNAFEVYDSPQYLINENGEKIINPELTADLIPSNDREGFLFTEDGAPAYFSQSSDSSLSAGVLSFSDKGFDPNQPYAGNHEVGTVNLYSGTLTRAEMDYALGGRNGMSIGVQRVYNSNIFKSIGTDNPNTAIPAIDEFQAGTRLNKPGPFGHGWSGWHYGRILSPMYFVCDMNNQISEWQWEKPDGSRATFIYDVNDEFVGDWRLSDGSRVEFINPKEHFPQDDTGIELIVITSPDGTKYIFSHHVYPAIGYIDGNKIFNVPGGIYLEADAVSCVATDPRGLGATWAGPTNTANEPGYAINTYTDLYHNGPYPATNYESSTVDNHLAGIYLTRIEDVHGNYIKLSYDEQNYRDFDQFIALQDQYGQYNSFNGQQLGYKLSFGSPYVSEVRDNMGRNILYEYLRGDGKKPWQKRISKVIYANSKGEEQYLEYTYGMPAIVNSGNYVACVNSPTNPSNLLGICVNDGFLRTVTLKDSEGNTLLPPTNYSYDSNTGELTQVFFGSGGSVKYAYTTNKEYFYDQGGSDLPGSNNIILRRTLHKMSVTENPSKPPIDTYYFYEGPDVNNLNVDDNRRSTYVMYPRSVEQQIDSEGNDLYDGSGVLKHNYYTVEKVEYLSPNPKKAFFLVLDHLQGVELKRTIYGIDMTTSPLLPVRYNEEVLNTYGEEIFDYDYTANIQSVSTNLRTSDRVSETVNHYVAKSFGVHAFFSRHLGGYFGNAYDTLLADRTPHIVATMYTALLQGKRTTNYEGGQRSTYSYIEYDSFGNVKKQEEFGVVKSAYKGAGDEISVDTSCNNNNVDFLDDNQNPKCYFTGVPTILDDKSFGPQEYKRTEIVYAHEANQPYSMPSYGNWFLGNEDSEEIYCNIEDCDPISDYRNVLFQIINLPTIISNYDINGYLITRTKNYYDEYNPELVSNSRNNFDSKDVGNHRQVLFQQGIDLSSNKCEVKQGFLTRTEQEYFENEDKKIIVSKNYYDSSGNIRKTVFPNQASALIGYDVEATEPVINNDACSALLQADERVENNLIIMNRENFYSSPNGNPIAVGDSLNNVKLNAKAYPTQVKSEAYKKNTKYAFNSGIVEEETISNMYRSITNKYVYDNLDRLIQTFGPKDILPKKIINYVDFPSAGMPQEVKVQNKLLEAKVLVILVSGNMAYENTYKAIKNTGMQHTLYRISYEDIAASMETVANRMEADNIYEGINTVYWIGDFYNLYLDTINNLNDRANSVPNSYGEFIVNQGTTIVFSKNLLEHIESTRDFQESSFAVYGKNIDIWDDIDTPLPMTQDIGTGQYEYHMYEDITAPTDSPLYPLVIPAGSFVTKAYGGGSSSTLSITNNYNYILTQDYPNNGDIPPEFYDGFAYGIQTDNAKMQFISLLPGMMSPETAKLMLEKLQTPALSGKYSKEIRYFYDGLGRNYVTTQQDIDEKYIVSMKDYDPVDKSIRREFKPIKIDNFNALPGDCQANPANAVECYLDGSAELVAEQPGIEYYKDALKRIVRIRTRGTDLGTVGANKDVTNQYFAGAGLNIRTDKEDKTIKTYNDGMGNILKEEILGTSQNKLVERTYTSFGTALSTTVKNYNSQGQDRTINYEYNTAGQLIGLRTPDSGVSLYQYDNMGNMINSKNYANQEINNIQYDSLNRIQKIIIDGHQGIIEFSYDDEGYGLGQIKTVSDYSGVWNYEYDEESRLIKEEFTPTVCSKYGVTGELCDPISLEYEYYPDGAVKSISEGENVISYLRDDLGRVNSVWYDDGMAVTNILKTATYTPSGALDSLRYGNEVQELYEYYNREIDLLKSHKVMIDSSTIYERGYQYTPSLNLKAEYSSKDLFEESLLAEYEYDSFNQLERVNDNNYYGLSYFYEYDLLGNILNVETNPTSDQETLEENVYEYISGKSQLQSTNDYEYEYDAAGRATKQLGRFIQLPTGNNWIEWYSSTTQQPIFNKDTITISATTPTNANLAYSMPVVYGQKYIVSGTVTYDISQGTGILGTGCSSNGSWLGPECLLDNFDTSRQVSGTGSQEFSFVVEATSEQATDLSLTLLCKLGNNVANAIGTISCSNIKIREANQAYTYDAVNMITMVQLEGGECIHYDYDFNNRRIFEADSATQRVTRYVFNGAEIHAKLEDDGNIVCPEEPTWAQAKELVIDNNAIIVKEQPVIQEKLPVTIEKLPTKNSKTETVILPTKK